MKEWDIYEEGYFITGNQCGARFIGVGYGNTFLSACKEFIKRTGRGYIEKDDTGKYFAAEWGCRWYPTLEEAQRSFG